MWICNAEMKSFEEVHTIFWEGHIFLKITHFGFDGLNIIPAWFWKKIFKKVSVETNIPTHLYSN